MSILALFDELDKPYAPHYTLWTKVAARLPYDSPGAKAALILRTRGHIQQPWSAWLLTRDRVKEHEAITQVLRLVESQPTVCEPTPRDQVMVPYRWCRRLSAPSRRRDRSDKSGGYRPTYGSLS